MSKKIIRYGMVGGSLDAFIGGVHRHAIDFEPSTKLVAGCFSKTESKNIETGEMYELHSDRIYSNFEEMALREGSREDKIDFVSVCTPNFSHYRIAKAFLLQGINVVCEKPLCFEVEEALELEALAKERDLLFAVTYVYSGHTMVKFAKQLVDDGEIGEILNVNAEYPQEWLIDEVAMEGSKTSKLSGWRTDPNVAGISNCVGDIGTHIENTVAYITGLQVKRVAARLDRFGNPLEMNANMLIQYDNGAAGNYWCSQVAIGNLNGLKVRIYGTKGAIEWDQEVPEELLFTRKGEGTQKMYRGTGYVYGRAAELSRIPSGHPEGYYEAFANTYKTYINCLLKRKYNEPLTEVDYDFPTVTDGVHGVKFVHAVIESDAKDSAWVEID